MGYALDRTLTQRAVLERDITTVDEFGAASGTNWQALATVPCRFWWWKQGYRGPAKEAVDPVRTAPIGDGGLILPAGTDVTTRDRVARVTDAARATVQDGPLNIIAVLPQEEHVEVAFRRP